MKMLRVFDIQRYALHDGPGIRTTIFLKGCPLNCLWCHNPESKSFAPQLGYLTKKCIYCGNCQNVCRQKVHEVQNSAHRINFAACNHCKACVENCLTQALKIFGCDYSVEELIEIAVKDRAFYENSNGGLTVSGGEPMAQFEGLLLFLKAAKKENLHVCLDTSGYARTEHYEKIMPYVDIFLYDYKATDREAHVKYTGVDNKLILENLKWLCTHGANVILRCPIIPSLNDNEEHFRAIVEVSQKFKSIIEVNLMPYHDMAKGKVAQIGETYSLSKLKTLDRQEKMQMITHLKKLGCQKLKEN